MANRAQAHAYIRYRMQSAADINEEGRLPKRTATAVGPKSVTTRHRAWPDQNVSRCSTVVIPAACHASQFVQAQIRSCAAGAEPAALVDRHQERRNELDAVASFSDGVMPGQSAARPGSARPESNPSARVP